MYVGKNDSFNNFQYRNNTILHYLSTEYLEYVY